MSSVEDELASLKREVEEHRKKIEILKTKIRAEMMVLDKLLDMEDPNEIRQSWERLKVLVAGTSSPYSRSMGIIQYLEELKDLEKRIEGLEALG